MDSNWRYAQNSRRMDTGRNGNICRHFLNGSCRLGSRCHYRHEWPVVPATQICRYFQKGGCWYGDRCRYLHFHQRDAVGGRRSSVPTVSSSVAHAPLDRRGSEPTLLQAEVSSRRGCSRSGLHVDVTNPRHNTGRLATDIAEERIQDRDLPVSPQAEAVHISDTSQASVLDGRNEQEASLNEMEDGGGAAGASAGGAAAAAAAPAAFKPERSDELEAYQQSKDVTCGICMETVYEKPDPRGHVFGILPNCSHSYCLQCIMTWRKTKDLGPDTVKTCPQCRVRSPFYVPNKYWVEGPAKEKLIAAFKKKFSKKSCSYYSRYRCCPFKSECLYRHDKHSGRRFIQYPTEDEDDYDGVDLLNLFIAMTLLSGDDDYDDDDDYDFPFYLEEEYGF